MFVRRFVILAVLSLILGRSNVIGATVDFAESRAGATAISNGSVPENLINGATRESTGYPRWAGILDPYFTIDLPIRARELPFEGLRLAGVVNAQPFELDVLDDVGGILASYASSDPQAQYDFVALPGIVGARRIQFRQPGVATPTLEIAEVSAWFKAGVQVGGPGLGQTKLTDLTYVGGVSGSLGPNVHVQIKQNGSTNLALTEVELWDAAGNALPVTGWGTGGLLSGSVQQLTDGIAATLNGAVVASSVGFSVNPSGVSSLRITTSFNHAAQDLSNLTLSVRNANNSTDLYYTEPLQLVGTGPGEVVSAPFTFQRTAIATLDGSETYEFEIDAIADTSDQLAVQKLPLQTRRTVLDLNGSSLQLLIRAGSPTLAERYQLLSADEIAGAFDQLIAPPLAAGLRWDFSRLYADGTVGVVPVPEPAMFPLVAVCVLAASALHFCKPFRPSV